MKRCGRDKEEGAREEFSDLIVFILSFYGSVGILAC